MAVANFYISARTEMDFAFLKPAFEPQIIFSDTPLTNLLELNSVRLKNSGKIIADDAVTSDAFSFLLCTVITQEALLASCDCILQKHCWK